MKACIICLEETWKSGTPGNYELTTDPMKCEVHNPRPFPKPVHKQPVEGTKNDTGKPQLSLLTRESLEAEARAFAYGAKKYDKNNYKRGMAWSRVLDAALRHLTAFNAGENIDPESNLCHLDHAKACVAMLVYYYQNQKGTDDR